MDDSNYDGLRERLRNYNWPAFFMFKFIVPAEKKEEIFSIFSTPSYKVRPSRNGKYVGITSHVFVSSEEAVIDIYKEAAKVEGVILL
jgi:putative lipoic acid-binding regulatory protein